MWIQLVAIQYNTQMDSLDLWVSLLFVNIMTSLWVQSTLNSSARGANKLRVLFLLVSCKLCISLSGISSERGTTCIQIALTSSVAWSSNSATSLSSSHTDIPPSHSIARIEHWNQPLSVDGGSGSCLFSYTVIVPSEVFNCTIQWDEAQPVLNNNSDL